MSLPDALAVIWRGTGERTGHNQAALKLQVRLDLLRGGLTGPLLQDGCASDHTSLFLTASPPPGALCLRDLGFFSLDVPTAQDAAAVFWLSRRQVQTAVFDAKGRRWAVGQLLAGQQADQVDLAVTLGVDHPLPARLLAVRVPQAVANERRRQLKAAAKHKGQTVSQARLALADWTLLVTKAPVALLTLPEALVLYRGCASRLNSCSSCGNSAGRLTNRAATSRGASCVRSTPNCWRWWSNTGCCSPVVGPLPDRTLVKAATTIRRNVALLIRGFRIRHQLIDLTEAMSRSVTV